MLHDRAEEVAKSAPFLAVAIVEQLGHLHPFAPPVTDQLAHIGPVFLFHPRVLVLVIGARAGEAERGQPFPEVVHQRPVEELAAIIGVEAQEDKGQARFDLRDALRHGGLPAVGHCTGLGPLLYARRWR